MKTTLCVALATASVLMLSLGAAKANMIDTTYAASGSPGDWLLNVSLTNNDPNYISELIFFLPSAHFFSDVSDPLHAYSGETVDQNGVTLIYWDFWLPLIGSGQSVSFAYELFDPTAPSEMKWNAFLGPCCSDTLSGTASAVPTPAILPLFASGLAGLGWLSRCRRKQSALTS
jgi:hypothetical protein